MQEPVVRPTNWNVPHALGTNGGEGRHALGKGNRSLFAELTGQLLIPVDCSSWSYPTREESQLSNRDRKSSDDVNEAL